MRPASQARQVESSCERIARQAAEAAARALSEVVVIALKVAQRTAPVEPVPIDRAGKLGILARAGMPAATDALGRGSLMTIIRALLLTLATSLVALPALALEVRESVEVTAPPEEVWQAISGFCSIAEWHPVVAECSDGEDGGVAMRTLTTTDGGVLVERRVQYSEEGMSYSYEIVESPLPVADYESTLAVMDSSGGSMITWSGEFAAQGAPDDEAVAVISGIYEAGLAALKERLQ
jgi:hypothetical protein